MRLSFAGRARSYAARCIVVAIAFVVPVSSFAQSDDVPRPAVDLKPGTAHYTFTMQVAGGRAVPMDLVRTIKSEKGTWVVTETTTIPGPGYVETDEVTVDKKTLRIRKRVLRDPGGVSELQFSGHKVTGTISNKTQRMPIDADLGTVIFADGAGGQDVLAALPLTRNYSTEFRNFDISSQQVKTLQLRVIDEETVTVSAGTFDTWKALIVSLDGSGETYALWVDKRSHRVVKMGISIPKLGDALAMGELTK
ncbi:MAG TPA: hypothetical protein VJ840_11645 [Gemmatimonadaceae bacterium]|nr:hypothetical protein [Gemmatimonadaceae bacterium]